MVIRTYIATFQMKTLIGPPVVKSKSPEKALIFRTYRKVIDLSKALN